MRASATKFPLGQWLLLAPLASELNDKNLNTLDQLLEKQATFCKEITLAENNNVCNIDQESPLTIKGEITQWTLQKVLMQLAHPEQEECSFFHAINQH